MDTQWNTLGSLSRDMGEILMMIIISDQPITVAESALLADVLINHGCNKEHFAVAVNAQFIPRVHYDNIILRNGDVIDIITPMQGG